MILRSHESLSTSRTSQLVRKIGSQNQSIDIQTVLPCGPMYRNAECVYIIHHMYLSLALSLAQSRCGPLVHIIIGLFCKRALYKRLYSAKEI